MRVERLSSIFDPSQGRMMGAVNSAGTHNGGFYRDSWLLIVICIVFSRCRLFLDLQMTMILCGAQSASCRLWNARTAEQ